MSCKSDWERDAALDVSLENGDRNVNQVKVDMDTSADTDAIRRHEPRYSYTLGIGESRESQHGQWRWNACQKAFQTAFLHLLAVGEKRSPRSVAMNHRVRDDVAVCLRYENTGFWQQQMQMDALLAQQGSVRATVKAQCRAQREILWTHMNNTSKMYSAAAYVCTKLT